MPKSEPANYRAVADYQELLEAFHGVAGMVLLEFAREVRATRDVIIRNLVARADMTGRAIFTLWDLDDFQDCWTLHRSLLDRLFHMWHLHEHDEFDQFEAWSFLEQYKAMQRVRNDSDPEFSKVRDNAAFAATAEQIIRVRTSKALAPAAPASFRSARNGSICPSMSSSVMGMGGFVLIKRHPDGMLR